MSDDVGGGASVTTDPAAGTSAATDVSLREHLAQRLAQTEHRIDERDRYLRQADFRLAEERDRRYRELADERDRRYAEVATEREKALKIKETADLAALGLAREIQTYKDEKANELREQISSERGLYATKDDLGAVVREVQAQLKPLNDYILSQQGRSVGIGTSATILVTAIVAVGGVIGIITTILLAFN